MKTKKELIRDGISMVRNLGFERVNNTNIFNDEIFSAFFMGMLEKKKGTSKYLDEIIEELEREIEQKSRKEWK
jgi:hypothetical protein